MRQKARNKRPRRKNCTPIRLHRAPVGSAGASQPQLAIAASASWPRTRPARPLGRKRKGRGRRRRREGGKGCARQGAGWGVHHRVQNGRMPCHAFPNTRDRTSRTTKRPCALRLHRCVHSLPVWRLGSIGRRTLGCGHRYRQRKQPGPQNCRMGILFNSRHGAPLIRRHPLNSKLCAQIHLVMSFAKQQPHTNMDACMADCTAIILFSIHPAPQAMLPRQPATNSCVHQPRPS